jgi:hypothetical protein
MQITRLHFSVNITKNIGYTPKMLLYYKIVLLFLHVGLLGY